MTPIVKATVLVCSVLLMFSLCAVGTKVVGAIIGLIFSLGVYLTIPVIIIVVSIYIRSRHR